MDVAEASRPTAGALADEGGVLGPAAASVLAGRRPAPVDWNLGGRGGSKENVKILEVSSQNAPTI